MATVSESVSQWITGLKSGEQDAIQQLWIRYEKELVHLARCRLATLPRGVADEDDIANTAFYSLCRAAAGGRLRDVSNRDDLWWILLALVKRKVVDHQRRETSAKRGGGQVRAMTDVGFASSGELVLEEIVDSEPTPEHLVAMDEQLAFLMSLLRTDELRRVAGLRLEGHSQEEIAAKLNVVTKTVGRKLNLIRKTWANELQQVY